MRPMILAVCVLVVGCGGSGAGGSAPAPTAGEVAACGTATAPTAGAAGSSGATGAAGAQGPQGLAGAPGAVGPMGPPGAAGSAGPEGPKGPTGAAGAVGPMGPAGAPGAPGAAGAGFSAKGVYQVAAPAAGQPRGSITATSNSGAATCGQETAQCAAGDILLSGSCAFNGVEATTDMVAVNGGAPSPQPQQGNGVATAYVCGECVATTYTTVGEVYPMVVTAYALCYHPG